MLYGFLHYSKRKFPDFYCGFRIPQNQKLHLNQSRGQILRYCQDRNAHLETKISMINDSGLPDVICTDVLMIMIHRPRKQTWGVNYFFSCFSLA